MEKLSVFADKGGEGDGQGLLKVMKKLPVGFRFLQTDEELPIHYLRNRTSRLSLPASTLIPELDVFRTDPWNLPGDQREKRYFFCISISTLCSQGRTRIATNSGHWKTLGKMKQISAIYGSIRVAGAWRTLAFRNNLSSLKSSWMLHEISLTGDDESRSEDRDWAGLPTVSEEEDVVKEKRWHPSSDSRFGMLEFNNYRDSSHQFIRSGRDQQFFIFTKIF